MQLTAADSVVVGVAQRPVSRFPSLSGRIPELEGLRGIAILLVVIFHYIGGVEHAPLGYWTHRLLSALTVGWSGVDLFFILSGFLIGGILLDVRNCPHYFRPFYMRRVFRILPIYYLWTLIYAALIVGALWLLPGRFSAAPRGLLQVPIHLLFLQNMQFGIVPFPWPWFAVTWSLAVEEQFYLLAPPLIRFLSSRRLLFVLASTICLAPLLRFLVFQYWLPHNFAAMNLMPCRADALASGVLLAVAWRKDWFRAFLAAHRPLLQRTLLALFFGVGVSLWWLAHPLNIVTVAIGFTWLAMFYSCLLLVVLSHTQGWLAAVIRWSVLRWLGTISYCVYLIHLTINVLAHRILLHSPPQVYNEAGVGVTLLAAVLTLAVATLSWQYLEKPLIRLGHTYLYEEATLA
jgi:peptidoglycan/LPS O-acetylase OafA/YrhL